MENLTIENITTFVDTYRYAAYSILFLAMLLEGESFLILAGALAQLEAIDIGDVFWVSLVGVIVGNIFWYYLGTVLSKKNFAKKMIVGVEKIIRYFLPRFHERPFKSIFFSKFIYGANRATVFMSGVFKVSFSLFMKAEVLASVVWVALYTAIGYFFGYVAIQMTYKATRFALLIVIFVLVFISIQRLIARPYDQRQLKENKEDSDPQR